MKKFLPLVSFILASLLFYNNLRAQCTIPGGAPDSLFPAINNFMDSLEFGVPSYVFNRKAAVHKILKKNNTYYLLGDFSNVAINHGPGVVLDSITHQVNSFHKWHIHGVVTCSAPDGAGGFYIGGFFRKVGDSVRNYFAHINSSGQPIAMKLDFNGAVEALYRKNDTLFIGGAFSTVNNTTTRHFAVYSIPGDSLITQNFNFPAETVISVKTIVPYGDSLFVGGHLNTFSGMMLYNTKTLSKDPYWKLEISEPVKHIEVRTGDSTLFFITTQDNLVVAVNTVTGKERFRVVTSLNNTVGSGRVYAIKRVNNKVYIAGNFLYAFNPPSGPFPRKGFCAIDATTGAVFPDDIQLNNFGRFLSLHKDKLYVSGIFNYVGGLPREHFVELDTATLAVSSWNLSPTDPLATLSFSQGKIFAGGYFSGVNSFSRRDVAAIDASNNSVLPFTTDRELEMEHVVRYAAIHGDTLFVLGDNIAPLNSFFMINLSTGQRISPPPMNFTQMNFLAVEGNFLYTIVDQKARRYFLHNLTRDATWGRSFDGITGTPIFTPVKLFLSSNKVYLVGGNTIAVMDKTSSQLLNTWSYNDHNTNFDNGLLSDSTLYVSGYFTKLNNIPRYSLAAINANSGAVTNWDPVFTAPVQLFTTGFNPSPFQLHNGFLWFNSWASNTQRNDKFYYGVNAADTATGVLLPPVADLTVITEDFGDYAGNVLSHPQFPAGTSWETYFDNDNNSMIVAGAFDFVNGIPATSLAKIHYQNLSAPVITNLSILGPAIITANADSIKYFVQSSNNTQSYSWSYTGTGVEIINNGNDTVYLKTSAGVTNGILKFKAVNYCGISAEITKTITIGTTDVAIASNSLSTATITPGSAFNALFTETNTGNMAAAPHKVYFYLSANNVLTPGANGDEKIGEYSLTADIPAAGTTAQLSQQMTLTCTFTPGNYYLFFVADGANIIAESNETNNSVSLPLTIVAAPVPTVDITFAGCPSATLNFSATITNGGSNPSVQWFVNGISAGNGTSIALNNVINGTQVVGRLTSGVPCANPAIVSDTALVSCITTGIREIDGLEKFLVSPTLTPRKTFVQLKLSKPKKIEFILVDLAGKTLYQYNAGIRIDTYSHEIDLGKVPQGVYVLKVVIGGKVIAEKVVKGN